MTGQFHLYPFQAGSRLELRKPHPCGGKTWRVERVGAEIRLSCERCGRKQNMRRRDLEKACRRVLDPADPPQDQGGGP